MSCRLCQIVVDVIGADFKDGVVRVRPDFKNRGAIVEIGSNYPLSVLVSTKVISFQKRF